MYVFILLNLALRSNIISAKDKKKSYYGIARTSSAAGLCEIPES